MTAGFVYVVRRNDPLDREVDVFTSFTTAVRFADAVGGVVHDEPILTDDDEYVQLILAAAS